MRRLASSALTAAWLAAAVMGGGGAALAADPVREIELPTPRSGPSIMAVAPDGSVYVALARAGKLGRVAADGTVREYPLAKGSFPIGIAVEPDGRVWYTDVRRNILARLDPGTGSEKTFPLPTKDAWPFQIVRTAAGILYFTERVANRIGRLDPANGTVEEIAVPTEGAQPAGLALTPDGQIFFTENSANKVGHLDPSTGNIVEISVPSPATPNPNYGPAGMSADAKGNVWFAELDGRLGLIRARDRSRIEEFPLPDPRVRPGGVAADRWGYVWYTGLDGNMIGGFDPQTGQFTAYPIPSGAPDPRPMSPPETSARGEMPVAGQQARSTRPFGIAVDRKGRVWFSEQYGHRLGTLTPPELSIAAPAGTVDASAFKVTLRKRLLAGDARLSFSLDGKAIAERDLRADRLRPGPHTLSVEARREGKVVASASRDFFLNSDLPLIEALSARVIRKAHGTDRAASSSALADAHAAFGRNDAPALSAAIFALDEAVTRSPASPNRDLLLAHLRAYALASTRRFALDIGEGCGPATVMVGDTLTWRNRDSHSLVIAAEDGSFRSPPIAPGDAWSHRFLREGKLAYDCGGAKATLAVAPRAAHLVEYHMAGPGRIPTVLTIGKDGVVWSSAGGGGYANLADIPLNNKIERLGRDGRFTEFATPTPQSAPTSIKHARDGSLWFTERAGNKIGHLDPGTGHITEFDLPTPNAGPTGIAVAGDGAVWFTEKTASKVGFVDPKTHAITEIGTPLPNGEPSTVVVDHEGFVWFDERGADVLVRMNPATRETRLYKVPTKESRVIGLVPDPRGYVWFLELRGNKIGRLEIDSGRVTETAVPSPLAAPFKAWLDPHGRLWFTEAFGNRIGVLDSGTVREFTLPRPKIMPGGIEVAASGDIWITEQMGNALAVFPGAANIHLPPED